MALPYLVDLVLHVDKHLEKIVHDYGTGTYAVLFGIVFCETGLVFLPFLPGDSLLFAAGALAGLGVLNLPLTLALLMVAAILGDSVNYSVGTFLGPRLHAKGKLPLVKKEHLDKTAEFYERYGAKTLVIARFVPIVRTFAPFVAGVGSMKYGRFMTYNVTGAVLWSVTCVMGGYLLGGMPIVKKNFSIVILVIIFISILPGIIGFLRERARLRAEAAKG